MVKVRDKRYLHRPPPMYKPPNIYLSVVIHYGGAFVSSPRKKYVGGEQITLDYVVAKQLSLQSLRNSILEWLLTDGEMRLFILQDNRFRLMSSDVEVREYCLGSLDSRQVVFYVEEWNAREEVTETEVNVSDEPTETNANVREKSSEVLGTALVSRDVGNMANELDDFLDSDYDMEEESDYDDDALFAQNVSNDLDEDDFDEESDQEPDVVHTEFDEYKDSDGEIEEENYPVFNPEVIFQPDFELGMIFSSREQFKKAIQSHAVRTKRSLKFTKTAPDRVYVKCDVEGYRKRKVKTFRQDVMDELGIEISKEQAYRAKKLAIKKLEGNPDLQYSKLWDYSEELRRTNPGSTVIVGSIDDENGDTRFDRVYVCLEAVKKGFKAACRPIIGIDGCHLKGAYKGILLTAVGVDANNSIYPIAWSLVSREARETWEWFLVVLKQDLDMNVDQEYTFMSDKQKGLIQAMSDVFPNAEHRFCVRHLHENFKLAGFRGQKFKDALWRAAEATTIGEWKYRMTELKCLSEAAWQWLDSKPAEQWSKSHFTEQCKCDILLNNGESIFIPPLPPRMDRGKGKHASARRKNPDERVEKLQKKKIKLRRKQMTVRYSGCGVEGHNSVTCGRDKVMKNKPSSSGKAKGESSGSNLTQATVESMIPPSSHDDEQEQQIDHTEISTQVSQSKVAYVPAPSMSTALSRQVQESRSTDFAKWQEICEYG